MAWKKKADPIKAETKTNIAASIAARASKSRKGRDGLTRVMSPIKGVSTDARQWNRWSP
jgi:hypothetical protein